MMSKRHGVETGFRSPGRGIVLVAWAWSACLILTVFVGGCSDDPSVTPRPSMQSKSDNAMRDPMNYSPFSEKPDMSSDGNHLERRSLKQDLNDVFVNP
jgi:hypothetical protein